MITSQRVEFPEKLGFLLEPHWLKVLYGGRGGIKSWSIAQALLLIGAERPFRVLCARELMKSIGESVHHLLEMQIGRLGLEDVYHVEKSHIYGPRGTEFAFTGLRDAHNLKSFESFDCCWVEEGANVSKRSWNMLFPTIRKAGSEIWVSFNPQLDTDETYVRMVLKPPPGAKVVKTSWRDNKWLSPELRRQIEHMRETAPDDFLNVYEGHCKTSLDGAIYQNEMRALTQANRITRVPYDPALPVQTFWDLGISDCTSIWFVQAAAFEWRFIDFLQERNRALPYYLKALQDRGYVYSRHWLPHDGKRRDLGTGKSIERHMLDAGLKVKIVPQIGLTNGMNAARNLFARAWFDEEKCADGLNCLRRYCWKVDPESKIYSKEPLHDDYCFTPDAVVLTRNGRRRIMDLPEDEEVLTPCGWRRYRGPWITRRNAPLVEVRFTDGFTVRCTPEHLFLAEDGWRSAGSLVPGTLIQSCLTRSRSISMAVSIAYTRAAADIFRAAAAKKCSAWFGRALSGLFQRVATFTTATATAQTMPSTTWSAFQRATTSRLRGTSGAQTPRPLRRLAIGPPSGTAPRPEGSGTDGKLAARSGGNGGSAKTCLASIAARFSRVWYVARLALSRSGARKYAKPLRITSVSPLAERADVYCINVEDGHWFSLGNGAVVHNCHGSDAYRMAAVALTEPERDKEEKRKQHQGRVSAWS